ncbi:hypothetical protein LTR08_003673 [Meristemomyces frigidus]|nr:hypothetical protein LTR08_003673 [Meristemomyces frigidus]
MSITESSLDASSAADPDDTPPAPAPDSEIPEIPETPNAYWPAPVAADVAGITTTASGNLHTASSAADPDDMPPAPALNSMAEVLGVPELRDEILSHVEPTTLLLATRVSKAWQKTITGTKMLRARLFLPSPAEEGAREERATNSGSGIVFVNGLLFLEAELPTLPTLMAELKRKSKPTKLDFHPLNLNTNLLVLADHIDNYSAQSKPADRVVLTSRFERGLKAGGGEEFQSCNDMFLTIPVSSLPPLFASV